MVWQPSGYNGSCNQNRGNQSAPLTLICFLVQYFGKSNDDILGKIYADQNVNENDYDFIIVGAGAAGCVVANRLSEQFNWKVLLLEAGDEEPRVTDVPGLYWYIQDSNIVSAYRTNDTKPTAYPRGKVMGGCSAINGMQYSRGSKADYDDWANNGNKGWSWEDVLPYFKKSEDARDHKIHSNYAEYHGTGGYLTVGQFPIENKNTPLFINALKEAGFNETDFNKGDQIGVGVKQYTCVHGTRLSANGAFIRPIRGKRSNLIVRPNSLVTRIIIDAKTKRATGVIYETKDINGTVTVQVSAKKEVIISAGVVDSPKLLMLSGIGPKNHLQQLNVPVVEDLSVGLNLQDHFTLSLQLTSNHPVLNSSDETIKADLFEWINTHEGPLSRVPSMSVQAYHQTKFENKSGAADIQFDIRSLNNMSLLHVTLMKSKSKGSIKLNNLDPVKFQPDIRLNPLNDSRDVDVLIEGLKFARKIGSTQVLKNAGYTLSTVPISECQYTDIDSVDYLRCLQNSIDHFSHGVGTCKMGPETDENAVVSHTLKVRGISGLRVIDASIMPEIVRGNVMAAVYMIGEKGSDMIKKDHL